MLPKTTKNRSNEVIKVKKIQILGVAENQLANNNGGLKYKFLFFSLVHMTSLI